MLPFLNRQKQILLFILFILLTILTARLWVSYVSASSGTFRQEYCLIQNSTVTAANCSSSRYDVSFTVTLNYVSDEYKGPIVTVPFASCVTLPQANQLSQDFQAGTQQLCYVDKFNGTDVTLTVPNGRQPPLLGVLSVSAIWVLAIGGCVYFWSTAYYRRNRPQNGVETGMDRYGDAETNGNSAPAALGGLSLEARASPENAMAAQEGRCLTSEEAAHVVRTATSDGKAANLCEEATCIVCLDELRAEVGTNVTVLPCNHAFHPTCIKEWLTRGNRLCPVCHYDLAQLTRRPAGGDKEGVTVVRVTVDTASADATQQTAQDTQPHVEDVAIDLEEPRSINHVLDAGNPAHRVDSSAHE